MTQYLGLNYMILLILSFRRRAIIEQDGFLLEIQLRPLDPDHRTTIRRRMVVQKIGSVLPAKRMVWAAHLVVGATIRPEGCVSAREPTIWA